MEVKKELKTTVTVTYSTPTHKFSVNEDKVEELKNQHAELQTKIQKGMKQIVDVSSPEWWEESWKSIFEYITGQKLLEENKLEE